jgi:hypothetical protein
MIPEGNLAAAQQGRLARWQWLCRATRQAADAADSLWKQVVDPPQ